jgi:tetratricopeptide (TPR) repeat protein
VSTPLLVDYYRHLPQPRPSDDPDHWAARVQKDLDAFRRQVAEHYTEGTLQRLLASPDGEARKAAALALGLSGTMASNAAVAAALHDPEPEVRRQAADALWSIWFRAGEPDQCLELQRLVLLRDPAAAVAGLDKLVRRAPEFAEAVNQRAIAYFKRGEFARSAADCERVLKLNPHHFGAAAGLGQCQVRLNKPRAALIAFRNAIRINPELTDVERSIRTLEKALGE